MSNTLHTLPPHQPINLNGADTQLRHLDERVDELQALREVMVQKGGVNREIAIAMEAIEEGVITTICPINGFTQDFSLTNADISMEALRFSIKDALVKMFKLFVQMIGRLLKWVFSANDDNRKRSANIRVYVRRTKAFTPAINEVTELTPVEPAVIGGLTKHLNQLLSDSSGLTADILTAGPYYNLVRSVGDSLPGFVKVLEMKVGVLLNAAKTASKAMMFSTELSVSSQLAEIRNPIPVDYLKSTLKRGKVSGNYTTLAEMMALVRTQQDALASEKFTLSIDEVGEAVLDGDVDLSELYIKDSDKLVARLQQLSTTISALDKVTIVGKVNPDMLESLRASLMVVEGELAAIGEFVGVVVNMCVDAHRLTSTYCTAQEEYFLKVLRLALASSDETTVSTARRIVTAVKQRSNK